MNANASGRNLSKSRVDKENMSMLSKAKSSKELMDMSGNYKTQ